MSAAVGGFGGCGLIAVVDIVLVDKGDIQEREGAAGRQHLQRQSRHHDRIQASRKEDGVVVVVLLTELFL